MNNVFRGKSVYLAFRTDMFDVENEHMTLKFMGNDPEWKDLMQEAEVWQSMLPVGIEQNGIATWRNKDEYHHVALMSFQGHPSLFGRNWHVTLESSPEPITADPYDSYLAASQMMLDIWIGFKDHGTGYKRWVTYKSAALRATQRTN